MTDEHKKFLVKVFQSNHNNCISGGGPDSIGRIEDDFWLEPAANAQPLAADGIYGPKTAAEIDKYLPKRDRMQDAWGVALDDVGEGGDGAVNNQGAYIDFIREKTVLRQLDGQGGAWCAVAISYWLQYAEVEPRAKSRSATLLCGGLEDKGWEELDDAADMEVGEVCVGLYSSGGQNRGRHVRLMKRVSDYDWEYIGGNERGDKVRHTEDMGEVWVERKLINLYRCPA